MRPTAPPPPEKGLARPTVSVIIPTRGSAPHLEACLEAVGRQTLEPLEILVVDNGVEGGGDRVREALPGASVLREEREGSYAARNEGIRKASGTLLAFTDADCVPDPRWLEESARGMEEQRAWVVAGKVEVSASDLPSRSPAEVLEMAFAFPQETYVRRQGFGVTANLTVHREVFSRVGLFREDLLSGGDFEWGRRGAEAGFPTVFHGGAVVRHPARKTEGELKEKEQRVTRGICHLVREGRYGSGRLLRLVLWALSPPLLSGWKLLAHPGLGPFSIRIRALGLLLRLRWLRLRVLMENTTGGPR